MGGGRQLPSSSLKNFPCHPSRAGYGRLIALHVLWSKLTAELHAPVLPHRPAELPRLEPPSVAHPGSSDALLVAPVHSVHHAVPTQQALPRVQRGLVSQGTAVAILGEQDTVTTGFRNPGLNLRSQPQSGS